MGAIPWNNPTMIEPFSSQGPNANGVIKPDIVAPDGVSTTTYGTGAFYGTSAAAPHAAGAAALVKELYPAYTHTQLKTYLESHAVDSGTSGKDNIFGSGRLRLGNPPGKIQFTTGRQNITAGTASNVITVQAQDAAGNPLDVASNTVISLKSSSSAGRFDISADGLFNGSITKVTIPAGDNSANFFYKDTISGTPTITAASTDMGNGIQQITINAGAANKIRVETAADGSGSEVKAQSLKAGSSLTVYGITRDQYNNYVDNPADTTWSLANPTVGVIETDLSAASGASVTLTAHLAGTAVIRALNGALPPGESGIITITKGGFDHLWIAVEPASTLSVDYPFDTAAVISACDIGGNPLSGIKITADRDPATGTGELRGTLTVTTNTAGTASFTNLGYNKTDAFKVRFSSGDQSEISKPVGPLSVGAVKTISLETPPEAGSTVDEPLATQPVIKVADQFDNPITGIQVTASLGTGTGNLRGASTAITNTAGIARFTNLGYNKSGESFTIRFTAGSRSINSVLLGPLSAGTADKIRVETAANGSGTAVGDLNLVSGKELKVYGITRDQYDNYIDNPDTTTWSLEDRTEGVIESDLSADSGASVTLTAHLAGTTVIRASNGTLTQGESGTIFVTLCPPAKITLSNTPAPGSTVDDLMDPYPVILVADELDNPVGGIAVTVTRGKGTGILEGNLTVTSGVYGLAKFTDLVYTKSGEQFSLHFYAGSMTADSAIFNSLLPGKAAQIRVETAADGSGTTVPAKTVTIGKNLTVYSIIRDQFGNFIERSSGAWSLADKTGGIQDTDLAAAADNCSAVFTGNQKGTAVIRVSRDSLPPRSE
ncbi:MAG: S8 family serine peptidase, partial [Dehalococcoidales bacterium]|nr:S8 family serine peptidase [Dehalococcoidales bacterium]